MRSLFFFLLDFSAVAASSSPTAAIAGVRNNSLSQTPMPDINELLSANIVLTTYDVLKEDLSHDSDRHEGDRRTLRFEKRKMILESSSGSVTGSVINSKVCFMDLPPCHSLPEQSSPLLLVIELTHPPHAQTVPSTSIVNADNISGSNNVVQYNPVTQLLISFLIFRIAFT
ncbi:hypothetical protein HAX54_036832 [Datura stramonium]|uniref:Uncharacterized protein n=1 Tax=Datura stramonium TaxID=4076 RepID=A0ABS8RN20_DATST|nr:hypothetical protein [Datura stramonium]